jgi:hypothetical protein
VKGREITYDVEPLGAGAFLARDQVNFCGAQDLVRQIRVLTVQRLTSNYYELLVAGDPARRAQHVINLLLLH